MPLPEDLTRVGVGEIVRLGDRLGDEVPPERTESLGQGLILDRRALYSFVRYLDQIGQRRARQCQRRGPRHGPRYVGDAVVHDALLDVRGIRVRRRPRRLYAPALVDGYVGDHAPRAHARDHLARYELGRLRPMHEYGPYDHVGLFDIGGCPGAVGYYEVCT